MTIKMYAISANMTRERDNSKFINQTEPSYMTENTGVVSDKALYCAVFMRAWEDLTEDLARSSWYGSIQITGEFRTPEKSALNWFLEPEGYEYAVSFSEVCDILGLNKQGILKELKRRGFIT